MDQVPISTEEEVAALVEKYFGLVEAVIRRHFYQFSQRYHDDLFSVGMEALWEAAKRSDSPNPEYLKFRIFASRRIEWRIRDFFRRNKHEVGGHELKDVFPEYTGFVSARFGSRRVQDIYFAQLFKDLTPHERQVVRLRFYEGCSFDEIADELGRTGMPYGSKKSYGFRECEKVVAKLQKRAGA